MKGHSSYKHETKLRPKYGSNRGQNTAHILIFFCNFLVFQCDHCFFAGFNYSQSGSLMIPDRLQYFWKHFWKDHKCDQIWTLGPRIYHQIILKCRREMMGTSLNILFHIWESEILKILGGLCTQLVNFHFWHFEILKFEIFENWNLGIWHFRNSKLWHLKFEFWILFFDVLNCEIWNFEKL